MGDQSTEINTFLKQIQSIFAFAMGLTGLLLDSIVVSTACAGVRSKQMILDNNYNFK